jgi:hypothetical protein
MKSNIYYTTDDDGVWLDVTADDGRSISTRIGYWKSVEELHAIYLQLCEQLQGPTPPPTPPPVPYVRAVIPSYASRDYESGSYSAWFVGHLDAEQIDDDVIQNKFEEYVATAAPASDPYELLTYFFTWLEQQPGYTVYNSWAEGWCTLPVDTSMESE